MKVQESAENYLERILMIQEKKGVVKSIDIAVDMNYTKPSISRAMKLLKESHYIDIDEKGSIHLTEDGHTIAKNMLERHRLLTHYLISLGVNPVTAATDACKIEHDLSLESFEAIKKHVSNK